MKEINIDNWNRKEHYNFFMRSDLPFYNVNFEVDVSGLKHWSKENCLSLNNVLIHKTVSAINRVDNFLYRIENGSIVKYEMIHPIFACIRENEELFRMITVEYLNNIHDFNRNVVEAIRNSKSYFDFSQLAKRSNFVFISPLPWIQFTGVDHTISFRKDDSIPRITWGKIFEKNGNMVLPYNIQVNHALVDGIHVAKFIECLQNDITNI